MVHTTVTSNAMTYHSTVVARIEDGKVILNTGGRETPTTKKCMNQFAEMMGLNYTVFQKDFEWFVQVGKDDPIPFDGNTVKFEVRYG